MRVLIQRVKESSVKIDEKIISKISDGLLVFVAFSDFDSDDDLKWSIKKVINLRIFNDENHKMNLSLIDLKKEVLIVSQFTLFAKVKKGNRPSWNEASSFQNGEKLYNKFINLFKKSYDLNKVQVGSFGSDMKINLTNDGPVTIFFDSKNKF